jgi:hypothetical protein
MWIETEAAESEFRHTRLGNDNAAGCTQPAHHHSIGTGRGRVGEDLRPGAGRLASNIEPVLEGNDCTVEGAERNS